MNHWQKIITDFAKLNTMVIGDVMIDSYMWGRVDRISPEAPVPVVDLERKEKRLGGAANVAKNIKAVGAECIVCSVIGRDEEGSNLSGLLEKHDISVQGIVKSADRITSIKHRIISGPQQLIRIDEENKKPLSVSDSKELFEKIMDHLPKVDVVIMQDYDKGVIGEHNITRIIEAAHQHKVPVVVDPKKKNFMRYKGVDLFKPNFKELKEGLNVDVPKSVEAAGDLMEQLKAKLHIKNGLITLSEMGMLLSFEDQKIHIPTEAKSVLDVSGAGDTVIALAALCYALKTTPNELGVISNMGAGLVCEELGVVPVNREKLLAKLINQ